MSRPMRLHADILEEELIVALVQRGPDVCAFAGRGCVSLLPGMIKLEDPGSESVALGEILFRRQILQVTSDVQA